MYSKKTEGPYDNTHYTATWANRNHLQSLLLNYWHDHTRLRIEMTGGTLKHCYVVCSEEDQSAFLHAGEPCDGAIIRHKYITAIVVIDENDNEISHRDVSVEPTYEAKKAIESIYA